MNPEYEIIADLVKRYNEASSIVEKRFKTGAIILLSLFFFIIALYFFLDVFFLHRITNAGFFCVAFFILGVINIHFSEKAVINYLHIGFIYFFSFLEIQNEIDKIQNVVLLDLSKNIDEIKQMTKEESGPWSEHGKRALQILESHYKWNLLT